jgi:hypothetical protein
MAANSRKLLLSSLVVVMFFSPAAWADNGYILRSGKEHPICSKVLEILNLPENAYSLGYRTTGKEFIIPARYTDFEIVQWTPVPESEISGYISPQTFKTLDLVKDRALTIEKDWDGKGDWEFETAQVDIDDRGKPETMMRYRLPNWKQWSCMLADTESEEYRAGFNPYITHFDATNKSYGLERAGRQCVVFKYKGRAYSTEGGALDFIVYESTPLPLWGQSDEYKHAKLFSDPVCQIWNTRWISKLKDISE